jgi:hypothetical protein
LRNRNEQDTMILCSATKGEQFGSAFNLTTQR